MIRNGLPNHISRPGKPPIRIHKYPHDIVCKYTEVLQLMPQLWGGKRAVFDPNGMPDEKVSIDAMVHIGMNPASNDYLFEKRARRDGYEEPGDDGVYLSPDALEGLPEELHTGFDLEGIAAQVKRSLPVGLTIVVMGIKD
jgi:hypothetical protein